MGDTLFCEEFVCFLNIQLRTNLVHILFSPFSAFTCMQFAKFYSFNFMDALSFFFVHDLNVQLYGWYSRKVTNFSQWLTLEF